MIDNCIVTKYELSEREKQMRRSFFQKSNGVKSSQVKSKSKEREKDVNPSSQDQEILNKLMIETGINLNEKQKITNNYPTSNSIPLNMIYSQNKILERNVDVLHETQRSLHDLLLYNMKGNQTKKVKHKDSHIREIKELIQPLCANYEEIKTSLHTLLAKQDDLKDEKLKSKVEDMITKHSEFKENSSRIQKSIQLAEKSKGEDKAVLSAITDLKQSIKLINEEVSKVENDFNQKFKRIIETIENKKLSELLGQSHLSKNTINSRLNSNADTSVSDMNYAEYRNEIYDISQRKDEILNEFRKNKLIIQQPFAISKEKIRFSYNLDDDSTNSSNHMNQSQSDVPNYKSNDRSVKMNLTQDKNVFLNNMNAKGKSGKKELNKSNIKPSIDTKPNFDKRTGNHHDAHSTSPDHREEEPIDVIEKMKRFKQRMESASHKLQEESKNHPRPVSINVNQSTKNSVQSTEPSSAKFFRSPKIAETLNKKLTVIPDEEVNEIKYAVHEITSKTDNNFRKEIKEIDVVPKEKQTKHILDDIVLKLCVDKMLQSKIPKNTPVPISSQEQIPFNLDDNQLRDIIIKLIVDYIRNLKRTKSNRSKDQSVLDASAINIKNKQEDNKTNTDHLMNMMDLLIDKINRITTNNNQPDTSNIEHIVERITEKMRSGMNINIHLPNSNNHPVPSTGHVKNEIQLEHHSLQIESVRKEIDDQHLKEDGEYTHPFSNRNQVDHQALEREIQMPYMINLNEYEVSSTSSYVTETHRTIIADKGTNTELINESYSHGQIMNESRDSSEIIQVKEKRNFDLLMLKTFNEKLKGHLIQYQHDEENVSSSISQVGSSNPQTDEITSDNQTSSVSQRQYVDINNKEQLKAMDLYDSNEYDLFRRQFNQSGKLESDKSISSGENNLKFYKPSQSGAPLILSFGNNNNVTSNRSNTNGEFYGNRMSFTKISNEEIENLIKRQNNLNDKLKLLAKGNNTISENNSEVDNTTIQHGEGMLKQSSEIERKYKTDESSGFY